ncbi:hypothetical protein ACF09K_04860 [Streptomyces sp. NPDC014882]|uniref:hypothetical protein n=1 Tax=Streptomyces sp. NPDC014882 TaxID=3364927 RepID=UPI0036F52D66
MGRLPELQGRGPAARAARAVVEAVRQDTRDTGGPGTLHAFPAVDHPASNRVCRRAWFTLLGRFGFEYPEGHWITSHDRCVERGQ